MALNIAKEQAALERATVGDLRERYAEVFCEPTHSRNKVHLIRRILWRLQANIEGDLSERARRRAMELANDAELRITAPRKPKDAPEAAVLKKATAFTGDGRVPLPGTVVTREYKGRQVRVTVLHEGFEFEGERYRSLSAVAKAVTGSHWNGRLFFGLKQKRGEK